MDIKLLTQMLNDPAHGNLKKMQYKYSAETVASMLEFLAENEQKKLPLNDFSLNAIVYNPSALPEISHTSILRLFKDSGGNKLFGEKAAEEEIYASLTIENISTTRQSIRRILNGYAPRSDDEGRIHGIKLGLDYIAQRANAITEENIRKLYELAVNPYIDEEDRLKEGALYREADVFITDGSRQVHRGIDAALLNGEVTRLCSYLNEETDENDLIKAAAAHFQIAYLHPYYDGNGRMARLINLWQLIRSGYSSTLFVPFSKYINENKTRYYQAFSLIEENALISKKIDITPFLSFFITNVYNKWADESLLTDRGDAFNEALRNGDITIKEERLWNFVLSFYGTEPFSTKQLEADSQLAAYATIRSFVIKFEKLGLLERTVYKNRNRYRVATE